MRRSQRRQLQQLRIPAAAAAPLPAREPVPVGDMIGYCLTLWR